MSECVYGSRRQDDRMAERVECGIALQALAGFEDASRYLRNCGVPTDVICRVLSTAIARRQFGMHLTDDNQGFLPGFHPR